jgi:hypothetical protein
MVPTNATIGHEFRIFNPASTSMIRILILLLVALVMAPVHAQVVPVSPVTNVNTGVNYASITEAIEAASAGDVLQLLPVRFTEHVDIDLPLTLKGDPSGLTIIDVSQEIGWGITLSSDQITLEDFSVIGGDVNTEYAVHSEPGITGLTIQNVGVLASQRSCIDLNGLTGPDFSLLENITVSGSSIGFGLALSACSNVTINNVNGSGNGFGDIAIMASNYYDQEFQNITFLGELDLDGPVGLGGGGIVVQVGSEIAPVGQGPEFAINIGADGFHHRLEAPGESLTGCIIVHDDQIRQVAANLGAQITELVSYDMVGQNLEVFPGMFVQSAINMATDNQTIKIEAGTADSIPLNIDKSLTLLGANAGIPGPANTERNVESVLPPIAVTSGLPTLDGLSIQSSGSQAVDVQLGALGLILKNSVVVGTGSNAHLGIVARHGTTLEALKVTGFDVGIVQHSGQLSLASSLMKENVTGLQIEHTAGETGTSNVTSCTFENAGGKAVHLSTGEDSDSFNMSNCALNLHETGMQTSSEIGVSLTSNAFSNSEVQLTGFSRNDELAMCAANDFSPALRITGCTDVEADNFEACANLNQGCLYYGCISPKACNFDADANADDGTCDFLTCASCPLAFACNYDPDAELFKVGACVFSGCEGEGMSTSGEDRNGLLLVDGCTIPQACNYNPEADAYDGSCTFDCFGCLDVLACNYDDTFTQPSNETCLFKADLYSSVYVGCDGQCYNDVNENGVCDEEEINGCMDAGACNFLSTATLDDGNCDFTSCAGCINPAACNFDADALISNGSCDYLSCSGCAQVVACNYDVTALIDDGSCVLPVDLYQKTYVDCTEACLHDQDGDGVCDEEEIPGCIDSGACNFDVEATDSDNSCEFLSCAGCTESASCNFNPTATLNDGSCTTPEDLYPGSLVDGAAVVDCLGRCNHDTDNDGVCDELEVLGCTDAIACNYDSNPTTDTDNALCAYASGPCDICEAGEVVTYDDDSDGVCNGDEILGCTQVSACNYDSNPTTDTDNDLCIYADGDCQVCQNGLALTLDMDNDGVCDADEVSGCTDSNACNYDSNPTTDTENDLCTYANGPCDICENGVVITHDEDNDGICDDDEVACIGDLNGDGLRGAADILVILSAFGCETNCGMADLNEDDMVAASDILLALSTFGVACPN